MQATIPQKHPRAFYVSFWGLVLVVLSLIFTLLLARFFFATYDDTSPSAFSRITQGINTQAIITDLGRVCYGGGGDRSVTIQYQDLHHQVHSYIVACASKNSYIGETMIIRYVPGYSEVEFLQDYQSMIEYYQQLGIIILVQITLGTLFLITHLKYRSLPG